jgi:hypothetical protein
MLTLRRIFEFGCCWEDGSGVQLQSSRIPRRSMIISCVRLQVAEVVDASTTNTDHF